MYCKTPDAKNGSKNLKSNAESAGAMTVALGSASLIAFAVASAIVVYSVTSGLGRQNWPLGSL